MNVAKASRKPPIAVSRPSTPNNSPRPTPSSPSVNSHWKTPQLAMISSPNSSPGLLHDFGLLIIANWGVFQWLLTLGELGVGLGLLFGVLGRLTAIGGFLLAFATFIFTLGAGTWTFDYLFEPVLFVVLAIAPPLPGLRLPWGTPRRRA